MDLGFGLFLILLSAGSVTCEVSRMVNPTNPDEACNNTVVPAQQDAHYQYGNPVTVKRKRRKRRQAVDQCVPYQNTNFCTSTFTERQNAVEKVWTVILRKHISSDVLDVKAALDGCLLYCWTCLEDK